MNYLRYSRDGTKLLAKSLTWEGADLVVIDPRNKTTQVVRKNITDYLTKDSINIPVLPVWYDKNRVLFFEESSVYSTGGKSLRLMSVDMRTGEIRNLQIEIDRFIHELVEEMGGYR